MELCSQLAKFRRQALEDIRTKGWYYSDFLAAQLIRSLNTVNECGSGSFFNLNGRDRDFSEGDW